MIADAENEEAPVAPLFAAMAAEIHYPLPRSARPRPAGGWTRRC